MPYAGVRGVPASAPQAGKFLEVRALVGHDMHLTRPLWVHLTRPLWVLLDLNMRVSSHVPLWLSLFLLMSLLLFMSLLFMLLLSSTCFHDLFYLGGAAP